MATKYPTPAITPTKYSGALQSTPNQVIGPGLGYNNDYATFDNSNNFIGVSNISDVYNQNLKPLTPVPTPTPQSNAPTSGGSNVGDIVGGFRWDGKSWTKEPTVQDIQASKYESEAKSAINQGYDSYFQSLDQMIGGVPNQQKGQEQIVNNSYNQGLTDINAQKESSMGDLATSRRKVGEQQVKSLTDIGDNIQNLFRTANTVLGIRGAGDSSAAGKAGYAITKMASKQRADVLSQTRSLEGDIADREAKVNNIVTQEISKLKTERDNNIIQVAQYFQDKLDGYLQAKAQGKLQKGMSLASLSTQLLQNAQQALMQADADYKNKNNTLMSWAASNSKTIGELKSNLAQLTTMGDPNIQTGQMQGINYGADGNQTSYVPGGSLASSQKRDAFGNLIG